MIKKKENELHGGLKRETKTAYKEFFRVFRWVTANQRRTGQVTRLPGRFAFGAYSLFRNPSYVCIRAYCSHEVLTALTHTATNDFP